MKAKYFGLIAVLFLLLNACMKNHINLAEDLRKNKNYEKALGHYFEALKSDPDRIDLKVDMDRMLKEASMYYYYLGRENETMDKKEMAVFLYKRSLDFDPANNQSKSALASLIDAGDNLKSLEQIKKEMEINVGLPEVLKDNKPMDLVFKTPVSLLKIFTVMAKSGKVNILFDSSFKDRKVKLSFSNVSFQQALDRLCTMYRYNYYPLDSHNIIITQDSADSKKRYKKLLLKNLYFSNIDAGEAKGIIESMIRPEKIIINRATNSLIVTGSPEDLALIEKLTRFIDKRKGEIEVDVEIVEVDTKKLLEYGSNLSSYQVGAEVNGFTEGKNFNDLYYLGSDDVKLTLPKVVWKFFSSATDSKIIARPSLRGLDREKIDIKLGEKRPIPRTTFVPVSSGGVDQQPITSYDLKDVGITVRITPTIHHNREVTLELDFELTYVTDFGGAYVPPTLGNRKVTTRLRLMDGETGIIAGLKRGSMSKSADGVPILSSIPLLKEIFSSRGKTNERTDILLSVTPRILRMPEISRSDMEAYLIGTSNKTNLKKWKNHSHSEEKIELKKGKQNL